MTLYYWPKVMHINSTKVFCHSFVPFVLIGAITCICLRMSPLAFGNDWITLIIKGGIFAIVFCLFSYILLNTEDRKFVMGIVRKRKSKNVASCS